MKKITLFGFNLATLIKSSLSSSVKNLSIGPANERSSFTLKYPIPGIPISFAKSTNSLNHELDLSAISSTTIPSTCTPLNGRNVVSSKTSVKSINSRGFLRSGLSVPNLFIDSL